MISTTLALPVLELVKDGIPTITICTMTDDPSVILFDHASEGKLESCRNVRVIAYGLYKLLSDHRVYFCVTYPPYDAVRGVK